MERVLIVGGGVGGTIVANLLSRKLRRQIEDEDIEVTIVDRLGNHVYQPGFMYITFGNEHERNLSRPERSLLDDRVKLVVGEVTGVDADTRKVTLADGQILEYDELVLAPGSRIAPEEIEHFETEAHHFYTADAARKLREALDAFKGGSIWLETWRGKRFLDER